MHGFSLQEHLLLASLIRCHRRKFPRQVFDRLPSGWRRTARRLTVLLRLAVVLHRSRRTEPLAVRLDVDGRGLQPEFEGADWSRLREAIYEGRGG